MSHIAVLRPLVSLVLQRREPATMKADPHEPDFAVASLPLTLHKNHKTN